MKTSAINKEITNEFLISIKNSIHQITNEVDLSASLEFMFDIFQDTGYLLFYNQQLNSEYLNNINELFPLIKSHSKTQSLSLIDFNQLDMDASWYKKLWENHQEFILDSPTIEQDMIVDQAWEKVTDELKQNAIELLITGLDIQAVLYAGEQLFFNIPNSGAWQKEWHEFETSAKKYLSTLIHTIGVKPFYYISDETYDLIKNFEEAYPVEFIQFLRRITTGFKFYAKYNGYRLLISPQESEEIFHMVSLNYDESTQSITKNYLYESALAEYALKNLITKQCFENAEESNLSKILTWKIKSTFDLESISLYPVICAGNNSYYVTVIPDGLKGFSVRNDLLPENDSQLKGVLFCSMKVFPSGEIGIRLDNYMQKSRFLDLIKKTPKINHSPHITKLSFGDVCNPDMRESFLENASKAVLNFTSKEGRGSNIIPFPGVKEKAHDILVDEFKKAAADSIELPLVKTVLIDNETCKCFILQEKDRIILRYGSEIHSLESVIVDQGKLNIGSIGFNEYEVEICRIDLLPRQIEVQVTIENNKPMDFILNLTPNE